MLNALLVSGWSSSSPQMTVSNVDMWHINFCLEWENLKINNSYQVKAKFLHSISDIKSHIDGNSRGCSCIKTYNVVGEGAGNLWNLAEMLQQ